jgi:transposase
VSLKVQPIPDIPDHTARVARAAFPKGNTWLSLRDQLGSIYRDEDFASLFPTRGQSAQAPWQLALVTVMQFAEGLSDIQAAAAVRARIDWKYALSLPLDDPGFDASVLCEWRARLLSGQAEERLLEVILQWCRDHKLLKERGKQRTDSTHVIAAIRVLNRLEQVGTTLRQALNALAVAAPEWLRAQAPADWQARYGARIDEYRLPKAKQERQALAEQIGRDGHRLLAAIYAEGAPRWLPELEAAEKLRRVWVQQYYLSGDEVSWRSAETTGLAPSALSLHTPVDVEARYSEKRGQGWVGYKAHLTETCDEDKPRLITEVETTAATVPDAEVVEQVHKKLAAKQLLPTDHLLDGGYIDADQLVRSRDDYGVVLWGPARHDRSWQAQAGKGFAAADFIFDWEKRQARCPRGQTSRSWQETRGRNGKGQTKIKFSVLDCRPCPCRSACTQIERRILTIAARAPYEAQAQAREREKTKEYAQVYAKRAGVEGSLSQAVRVSGLRHARYVGLAKTHLQNVLTAAAMNVVRVIKWVTEVPLAKTRRSPFVKLMRADALTG